MRYVRFLVSCASLCCLLLQASCSHKKKDSSISNESDISEAAGLYSQMSTEELVAFQAEFVEGMWDRVHKEQMPLPPGFDLDKAKDYVKQGLLPVFLPLEKGGWRVSEVRPSVLSKLLTALPEGLGETKTPFLKNAVSTNFKKHRKLADLKDYENFVAKYLDKTKEVYAAYTNNAPIENMRVEASPVSEYSKGQRILIYGDGPFHMTTYLKFRSHIIGLYKIGQDGSMDPYAEEFKLDAASMQLANLFSDLTRDKSYNEASLEMMMHDAGENSIAVPNDHRSLVWNLNKHLFSQAFGMLSNWDVMEFLIALNPDAQFVLVFDPKGNNRKETEELESSDIPFKKGSSIGANMVEVLKKYDINFMSRISMFKSDLQNSLKDYWTLKCILKELPDLLVFVPAYYVPDSPSPVRDKIEQSLLGIDDLTSNGLIFVSDAKQKVDILKEGMFLTGLSKRVGAEVFSLLDLARNIIYTNIPWGWTLEVKHLLVQFQFIIPYGVNVGFEPFGQRFWARDEFVLDLLDSQFFSPKGATPLVLSYFSWLRQGGVVKSRLDAMKLFNQRSGLPVFIDAFKQR